MIPALSHPRGAAPKHIPCARAPAQAPFIMELLEISRSAHGVYPGSAQPGHTVGWVEAEFPKRGHIVLPALHIPRRVQNPFPC